MYFIEIFCKSSMKYIYRIKKHVIHRYKIAFHRCFMTDYHGDNLSIFQTFSDNVKRILS